MSDSHPGSADKPALRLDEFLCFAVYSAAHAFNRAYKPLLAVLGLTYPQYLVMAVLWEKDGQTVGNIGERLFLESSTLTPLLKRLEAMGLILRMRDRPDERVVRVVLTDAGLKLKVMALDVPSCILDSSGLAAEDAMRLQRQIEDLRVSLLSSAAGSTPGQVD